jgi:hypothetical protein
MTALRWDCAFDRAWSGQSANDQPATPDVVDLTAFSAVICTNAALPRCVCDVAIAANRSGHAQQLSGRLSDG